MMKPARMTRVMIAGSKDWLGPSIERLYETGLLHPIDFSNTDELKIGSPLPPSAQLSEKMIKTRNMIKTLGVEEQSSLVSLAEAKSYIESGIESLEQQINEQDKKKQALEEESKSVEAKIREIEDIENLPLRFEDYSGYQNIAVFVGKTKSDVSIPFDHDIFEDRSRGVFALFVPRGREEETRSLLGGFAQISVPPLQGAVKERANQLRERRSEINSELAVIAAIKTGLMKENARLLLACQEELDIMIRKAELPLRIATTQNSFIINGWVTKDTFDKLSFEMERLANGGVYVEMIESSDGHSEHGNEDHKESDEAPVKLDNAPRTEPFEGLLKMYSLPRYGEIDPTAVLFFTYPMFFGLMVGDLMYGLGFILLGRFLRTRSVMGVKGKDVAPILIMAGVWSCIFGVFLFGEFMGIHYNPPLAAHVAPVPEIPLPEGHEAAATEAHAESGELYWSNILGFHIPNSIGPIPLGIFSKLHNLSVLLRLSLIIGLLQINLGLLLGYLNEKSHDARKALFGKIGWIVFQIGFFTLFFSPPVEAMLPFAKKIFVMEIALPHAAFYVGSIVTVISLVMLYLGEGVSAIMETPGIFSNMLSYTRLIAVGLSKAGMALAVNNIGVKMLILNGNIIAGFLVLLPFHLLIFVLGIIAAGLHSLRLQYVEFFTKFYQGGGVPFNPLREERTHTNA